jgi:L-alanine-DL-glutamate epimerase-like enolase superfamily enzyme
VKALHTPAAHDLRLPEFAATYPEHGEVRARTRHRRASEASLAHPRTGEGPSGLGERFYGAGAVDADVHETLAPLMRGQDPRRTYNTCAGTDDIKDDTDQSAEDSDTD